MGEEATILSPENTQQSTSKKEEEETTLKFLDSVDHYLVLIHTLSSTLRQGWLELASARYSMGGSRVNTALLNLKHHSAATTVELNNDNGGSVTTSPQFGLHKWTSSDNKDSSSKKENIEEDEQLNEYLSSPDSEKHESTLESSDRHQTDASARKTDDHVSDQTDASARKTDDHLQKERAKVLSTFGTLVSPKLRASQLSFETALETLVELANARSSILEAHDVLHKDMKSTKK
uniref:coiled-coil domain-containing protein 115 isoform X1 n=1 Tax=Erigeron canadensis TaxID=72917 RepID=UPI001CB9C6F9|nr:coiled-coil domain-containing protein 115 isoform X1 [Erigeron canadensis]